MSEKCDWRAFGRRLSVNPMNFRVIITGSTAELNLVDDILQHDLDLMFYYTDVISVASSDDIPKGFQGLVIKCYEYSTLPGYVKIQKKDRVVLIERISPLEFFKRDEKLPARKLPHNLQWYPDGSLRNLDIDAVFSILCPGWPTAAIHWTTRSRPSGWPTNDLIDVVVNGGHHLVEKSHPLHTGDDIVWRISFSKAESYLIDSWTKEQKDIYYLLRSIKQNVVKTCGGSSQTALCTYHFKTLMLWQCEKRPPEFWMRGNISTAIVAMLCEMIVWLMDKEFPNYFIPENNMLNHLPVDHCFSKEIEALSDYLCEERVMLFIIKHNYYDANSYSLCKAMSMFSRYIPFLEEKQLDEIEIVPFEEFEILHMALKLQVELRRSARGLEISGTTVNLQDATEETLLRAVVQNHETSMSIDMLRLRVDNELSCRSSNMHMYHLLCSRKTFFVCVTYLANFYYVSKRDYERSRSLCRKVFECIYMRCGVTGDLFARGNAVLTELSFPVLLSTEWLDLFDENIQTIVGFLTVYGFHATDRNCNYDEIKICPTLFLHYINVQCEMHLGTDRKSLIKAFNGFTVHFRKTCPSDIHPWDVSTDQRKLRATILLSALALRRRLLRLLE